MGKYVKKKIAMIDFLAKIQYLLIYQLIGALKENSTKKLYF